MLDSVRVVGAAARLTRLVVVDDIGQWWIKEPVDAAMQRYADAEIERAAAQGREPRTPWWWKYRDGLECKWCAGFWVCAGTLAGEHLTRDTPLRPLWRFTTAALALNYLTANLAIIEDAGMIAADEANEESP